MLRMYRGVFYTHLNTFYCFPTNAETDHAHTQSAVAGKTEL